MPLHPQTAKVIDHIKSLRPKPILEIGVEEYRKIRNSNLEVLTGKPQKVSRVEDKNIPGPYGDIAIRIYTPNELKSDGIVIYYPGSGFVDGTLASQDNVCRQIANLAGCVVIQSSYRSAPEFKYPVQTEEVYATLKWVIQQAKLLEINPHKIALAGYSSGTTLVASCVIRARDENIPIKCFVLNAPALDLTLNFPSIDKYGEGYLLDKKAMEFFINAYLPENANRKDPKISPYYADLKKLPLSLIQVCEFDPLYDDGKRFSEKLKTSGNQVTLSYYEGQIHGLLGWCAGVLNEAKNPCEEIGDFIKEQFKE